MASRVAGGPRLTILALDLSPREYAALTARYRSARRALESRALGRFDAVSRLRWALPVGAVLALGIAVTGLVFIAAGAPLWLALAISLVTFVPVVFALRRGPYEAVLERHPHGETLNSP